MKVNVTVEISDGLWERLQKIGKELNMKPEDVVTQTTKDALAEAEVWLERASLIS